MSRYIRLAFKWLLHACMLCFQIACLYFLFIYSYLFCKWCTFFHCIPVATARVIAQRKRRQTLFLHVSTHFRVRLCSYDLLFVCSHCRFRPVYDMLKSVRTCFFFFIFFFLWKTLSASISIIKQNWYRIYQSNKWLGYWTLNAFYILFIYDFIFDLILLNGCAFFFKCEAVWFRHGLLSRWSAFAYFWACCLTVLRHFLARRLTVLPPFS